MREYKVHRIPELLARAEAAEADRDAARRAYRSLELEVYRLHEIEIKAHNAEAERDALLAQLGRLLRDRVERGGECVTKT